MLVTLKEMGDMSFNLVGTNGFRIKAEKETFSDMGLHFRQNLKFDNFTSSFGRTSNNFREERAARPFFLIQPIILLICEVSKWKTHARGVPDTPHVRFWQYVIGFGN